MNKDLDKFGFEKAGSWINKEENKEHFVIESIDKKNLDSEFFLYAFVIDDQVMYIGKSDRTVRKRLLSGWAKNKKKYKKKSSSGGRKLYESIVFNNETVEIYLNFPFTKIEINNINMPDGFKSIEYSHLEKAAKKRTAEGDGKDCYNCFSEIEVSVVGMAILDGNYVKFSTSLLY